VVEEGLGDVGLEGIPSRATKADQGFNPPSGDLIHKFKIALSIAAPDLMEIFGRSFFPPFRGIWGARTHHNALDFVLRHNPRQVYVTAWGWCGRIRRWSVSL